MRRVVKKADLPEATTRPGFLTRINQLLRSRDGVGAVEFTLIAPILLIIYLMSFEITVAISLTRKASHAASDIADLVTQKTTVDKSYLGTMTDVAQSIMAPYGATGMTLKITGITIDSSSNPTVTWSWKSDGSTPYTAGASVSLPSDLKIASSFLVHSEISMPYSILLYLPGLSGTQTKSLTIAKDFYFRQRIGSNITCSDC